MFPRQSAGAAAAGGARVLLLWSVVVGVLSYGCGHGSVSGLYWLSGITMDGFGEVASLAVVLVVGVQQVAAGGGVSPMCGRCWHVIDG